MAHLLFVAYDLVGTGRDYSMVIDRISDLGEWRRLQHSLMCVKSMIGPLDALEYIRRGLLPEERLAVVGGGMWAVFGRDTPSMMMEFLPT